MVLLGLVFGVSCVYLGCCYTVYFVYFVTWPSDWLEKLVPEMTCYVSSWTLSSAHLHTWYTMEKLALFNPL